MSNSVLVQVGLLSLLLAFLAPPFAAATAGGGLVPKPEPRIIGGVEAPEGRYSYAVTLKDFDGAHYCGGSLIGSSIVLTAAHCVAFDDNFTVVVGRYNLTEDDVGDDISIARTVPHPGYDMMNSFDYDIALVFLSRPVSEGVNVDIVRINADGSMPLDGSGVTYLGWGEIDADSSTVNVSDTLREVEAYVVANGPCEASAGAVRGTDWFDSYKGQITDNMICTHAMDKDSCQKDSGGPLILRGVDAASDVQVGIASWGIDCASDIFPGVAARISSVYDWIVDTVCENGIDPGPAYDCATTYLEIEMSDSSRSISAESQSTNMALAIITLVMLLTRIQNSMP